jgi:hypothetical protein
MFVYRDAYYLARNVDANPAARNAAAGKAEILVAKQRRGPTGVAVRRGDDAFLRRAGAGKGGSTHNAFIELGLDRDYGGGGDWPQKQIERFRLDLKAQRHMRVKDGRKVHDFRIVAHKAQA